MAAPTEDFGTAPSLAGGGLPNAPTMYDAYQVLFPRYFRRVMRLPNVNHYWPPWQLGMQTSWDTSAACSSARAGSAEEVFDVWQPGNLEDSLPPLKRQRCELNAARRSTDSHGAPRALANGSLSLTLPDLQLFRGAWGLARSSAPLSFHAEEGQEDEEDVDGPVVMDSEQDEEEETEAREEQQGAEVSLALTEASPYTCRSAEVEGLDETMGCVKGTWCEGAAPFDSQSLETTAAGSSGQAPSAGSAFVSGALCYTHAMCSSPTPNCYALESPCGDPCGFLGVSGGAVEDTSTGVSRSIWSHCHDTGRTTRASGFNTRRAHPETHSAAVGHAPRQQTEARLDGPVFSATRKVDRREGLSAESPAPTSRKATTESGAHARGQSEAYVVHLTGLDICGEPQSVVVESTAAHPVRRKTVGGAAPVSSQRLTAEVLRQLAQQYETEDQQRSCRDLYGAKAGQVSDPISAGGTAATLQRSTPVSPHLPHEAIAEGLLKHSVVGVRDRAVALGQAPGTALITPGFSVDVTVPPNDVARESQVLGAAYCVSAPVDDLDGLPTEELQRAAGSDDAEDFLFFVKNRVAAIRQREREQQRVAHRERRHERRALLRFPKTNTMATQKQRSVENGAPEQSNHAETARGDQFPPPCLRRATASDGENNKIEKRRQYSCRVSASRGLGDVEIGENGKRTAAKLAGKKLDSWSKDAAVGGCGGKAPEEDLDVTELSSSSSSSDSESSGSSVSYKSNGAIVDGPINPERVWRATAAQLRSEGKDVSEIAFEMACHLTPAEARREHRRRRSQRRFVRRSAQKASGKLNNESLGSFPMGGLSGGGPQDDLRRALVPLNSSAARGPNDGAREAFCGERPNPPVSGRRWERRITYLFALLQKKRDRGLLSQATFEREKRKLFDLLFEWDATQNRVALRQTSGLSKTAGTSLCIPGQGGGLKVLESVGLRRGVNSRARKSENLRPAYENSKQGPAVFSSCRPGAYSGRPGRSKVGTQPEEESSLDLTEEIQREFFHQDLQCFALDVTTDGTDDDPVSSAFGDSEQGWSMSTGQESMGQRGYNVDVPVEQPLSPGLAGTSGKRPSPLGSAISVRQLARAAAMDSAGSKDRTSDKSGGTAEEGPVQTRKPGVPASPGPIHARSQPRWRSQVSGGAAPQQQSVSQRPSVFLQPRGGAQEPTAPFLSPWAARVAKRKEEERKRKRNFERRQMLMRRFDQRAAPEHRMFKQDTSVLRPGLTNAGSLRSTGIHQTSAMSSVETAEGSCQAPIPVWLLEATRCREHRLLIFPEDIRKL